MGKEITPSLARSAKLRPAPLRKWTVRREGLMARLLNDADDVQAIVFEAPPGYGKSTAMRQWLEIRSHQGWRTAWISLDTTDDEPLRFASLLIGACRLLCRQSVVLGATELVDLDSVVDLLLSRDFANDPAVLFIDDFHLVANGLIQRAIGRLIAGAPEGLQIVISSRIALPLAMAKARLSGAVVCLRDSDLALDQTETRSMLENICGRSLGPEECEKLRSRAGGWAAMLQMAGLALEASSNPGEFVEEFSGTDVEVSRYLCEVALDLQSEQVRRLLLATSPLDMFSPELCTALTGLENARALLEEIEARHLLLIPLDRQRRWFKYHALFREFLESRLEIDQPGERRRILSAASQWFHRAGEVELAVEHALRGGDYAGAAAMASDHVTEIALRRGELETVQRWIFNMPREILDRHPALKIGLAWAFTFRHRIAEADRLLREVEDIVDSVLDREGLSDRDAAATRALCDMIRGIALATSDQYQAAVKYFRNFERKWDNCGPFERGSSMIASAYAVLALGRVREARRLTEEAEEFVTACGAAYSYGWNQVVRARIAMFEGRLGDVISLVTDTLEGTTSTLRPDGLVRELLAICAAEAHYEANRLEEARQSLLGAGESVLSHVTIELGETVTRVLARLAIAADEPDRALDVLRRSIAIAEKFGLPRLVDLLGGEMATILLRLGRPEDAWRVDEEMGLSQPTTEEFVASLEMRQMVQARLVLSRGEAARAARLVSALLNRVRSTGNVRLEISALCLLAAAQWQIGEKEESRRLATQARLTASQSGLRRAIIDEDYLLDPLSDQLSAPTPPFVMPDAPAAIGSSGLSHREGHVLSLISQGMTNRDIAAALVLSEETVKWHMRNITRKLNARNRTHAVQIARQSGLLH